MVVNANTEIGSSDDIVSLFADGRQILRATRYSVTAGVMAQPSSFSMTLGSGDLARKILQLAPPGKKFELKIGNSVAQTGIIEDPAFGGGSGATEVTLSGRDPLSTLLKRTVVADTTFSHPTYLSITRAVLDLCGYSGRKLYADNEVARRQLTRSVKAKAKPYAQLVEQTETGIVTRTGSKLVHNQPVAKVGQNWLEFLKSQYKQVGLYLWASASGDFVLARPTAKQVPLYSIVRFRGAQRTQSNLISLTGGNKTSTRHARCRVVNRTGRGENKGLHQVTGTWIDTEMSLYGFDEELVIYDKDCKTPQACEYLAKRTMAEERRASCALTAVVSGHTAPSLLDSGAMVVWAPDTMVSLYDEETGIDDDFYIESVNWSRNPQTTTTLTLMSKTDLVYLGESDANETETEIDATGRAMTARDRAATMAKANGRPEPI